MSSLSLSRIRNYFEEKQTNKLLQPGPLGQTTFLELVSQARPGPASPTHRTSSSLEQKYLKRKIIFIKLYPTMLLSGSDSE